MGNTLFFCVSGYTWAGLRSENSSFISWYKNKIERIWVPTIFTNIVYVILKFSSLTFSGWTLFKIFVYPNKSWFCGAILLYAIFYYYIAKNPEKRLKWVVLLTIVVYFLWYITRLDFSEIVIESIPKSGLCRVLYYFLCMIVGLNIRMNQKTEKCLENFKIGVTFIGTAACCYVLAMGYRFIFRTYELQFLVQLFTLCSVVFLFKGLYLLESVLKKFPVNSFIQLLAEYSWEIYLTQTLIIPYAEKIIFPFNLIVVVIAVAISSYLLKRVSNWVVSKF